MRRLLSQVVRMEMAATFAPIDERTTDLVARRYDQVAPAYDLVSRMIEPRIRHWRQELWSLVRGERILELGIGTGSDIPFHPRDREIIGVDISPRMLERARAKANEAGLPLRLEVADVQRLPYQDESFDAVVATFLFCAVPDPVRGLSEAKRVLKPGGQLLLLEHVLSRKPIVRRLMRAASKLSSRLAGEHFDRETSEHVKQAGFTDVTETHVSGDIVRRIEARKPSSQGSSGPGRS